MQIFQRQPADAMRTRDRRSSISRAYQPCKRISEFTDRRECRCSTGILPVWPIGILPVASGVDARLLMCVTTSSPGETPACLTDKMSVLLSLVTKFDFRQQDCIKG